MTTRRLGWPVAIVVVLLEMFSTPARAQLEVAAGAGAVVLSGQTVKSLIARFEEAGNRLIQNGENSGNALLVQMGNQVRVATQNANIAMSDQQDKVYENLGLTEQTFFTELNRILEAPVNSLDRAVSVLEVANLNLVELTNRLRITEQVDFYINNVQGLTQPYQAVPYEVGANGLGFGQDVGDRKYQVSVSVAEKQVGQVYLQRTPPYALKVRIPPELIEGKFADDKIQFVPLKIAATVSKQESCSLVFHCDVTKTAEWNLVLTLLPKLPVIVSGNEVVTRQVLDGNTKTTSVDVQTSGCETHKPCDWQRTIPLAQNERVTNVRYACSGQCGWSYNLRRGGYEPDYDVLEGGTKVVVYRHVDAGNTVVVTYYVDYQTLKADPVLKPILPVKANFGQAVQIPMSVENGACAYRLAAKLATGQSTYIDNSMGQSPDGLLVRVGTGQGGAGVPCAPTFKMNIP